MPNERETSLGQRGGIILCVDDEPNLLRVRQLVLSGAGYKVLTATEGKTALEIFKHNSIDLVISDHLLPDISGAQVAIEMKRQKPDIPIILLTGLPEAPEGAEHADMFLTKGMSVPELLASVAQVINRKRSANQQHGAEKAG